MIITKKHIALLLALLMGLIGAGVIYRCFEARQTAAVDRFTVVLDAGHGGYAECFKTENKV